MFILSGAEDLVPICKKDKTGNWVNDDEGDLVIEDIERDGYAVRRYRPRIEGLFARIERWTNQTDAADSFWRSISKDNVTTWYGRTAKAASPIPLDATCIF